MSMCKCRELDNIFERILCNRHTVEHYDNDPISISPIDHHTVFSTLHLYKLIKDYKSDVNANKLELFTARKIHAIEFLLGFWLVRVLSFTPNCSALLHSEIAFHLPLWQIVLPSWQTRLQPQQLRFIEQYFWQRSRASVSANRKSLGKANSLIVLLVLFLQVISPSFCWNSPGNTVIETFVWWIL